jgi:membrane-bound serine protease (ClpP class)
VTLRQTLLVCAVALLAPMAAAAAHVNLIRIDGSINPASSSYLQKAVTASENDGAAAIVVELDTPGGLLAATKDIVQSMLNAKVPVVVFVSPRGGWAASAGAFITMAGHVAAMAPGTSIGAASPVSATGGGGERGEDDARKDVGMEKAEKFTTAFIESIARERGRNVEWAAEAVREAEAITETEALDLNVIDLIAQDLDDLLEAIQGREVKVDGEIMVIDVAGAELRRIEMEPLEKLFNFLASPDVATLLLMAGLLGLYVEFNSPGLIVPGVAGLACLILAGIAFQILPFSWVGLMIMGLGIGLLVAEIFTPSFGVLFALGLACLLFGGMKMFDLPEVSDLNVSFWSVLVPLVTGFGVFAGVVVFLVSRTLMTGQTAGVSELIGRIGQTSTALAPDGKVFVRGEYWSASADEEIDSGESVEITAVDGLRLQVRRAPDR